MECDFRYFHYLNVQWLCGLHADMEGTLVNLLVLRRVPHFRSLSSALRCSVERQAVLKAIKPSCPILSKYRRWMDYGLEQCLS